MAKIFIDTSAWVAFAIKSDPNHAKAKQIFKNCLEENASLFTSNDIIDEATTRLIYGAGFSKAKLFYQLWQHNLKSGLIAQLWTDEQIQTEAWQILVKFKDHKLSLTDASSIALFRRFKIDAIFTFDSDFRKVNIPTLPQNSF